MHLPPSSLSRTPLSLSSGLAQKASLRYKFSVVKPDGRETDIREWRNNLIQNAGLDLLAVNTWPNCIQWGLFGNAVSPVPVRRDSSPITFTQVGTTITATGSFFVSADSGRLLKYNDGPGTEVYLIYVSPTVATANISISVVAQTGTVWYVNETALTSVYSASNTAGLGGSDNGTTVSGSIVTHKKTIIGGAVGGTVTFTEIGFSNQGSNANVFDRDIITGGITLSVGDQPKAVIELSVTYSPTTTAAVGNVATGYSSAGNAQIESCGDPAVAACGIALIASNGTVIFGGSLEPSDASDFCVLNGTITLSAFAGLASAPIRATVVEGPGTNSTYTAGTFTRDTTCVFGNADANGVVNAISLGQHAGGSNSHNYFTQVFTAPPTKLNTQTLSFTFTKTWGRILVN